MKNNKEIIEMIMSKYDEPKIDSSRDNIFWIDGRNTVLDELIDELEKG